MTPSFPRSMLGLIAQLDWYCKGRGQERKGGGDGRGGKRREGSRNSQSDPRGPAAVVTVLHNGWSARDLSAIRIIYTFYVSPKICLKTDIRPPAPPAVFLRCSPFAVVRPRARGQVAAAAQRHGGDLGAATQPPRQQPPVTTVTRPPYSSLHAPAPAPAPLTLLYSGRLALQLWPPPAHSGPGVCEAL